MKNMEKAYLNVEEAAAFTGLKVSRLRYEVLRQSMPYFKVGKSVMFSKQELQEWLSLKRKEVK